MNQNQESFKNLISPDVTKQNYTIMNNDPSKKAFHFGMAQNRVKARNPDQLTTMTNQFLQMNLQPQFRPQFNKKRNLSKEELK